MRDTIYFILTILFTLCYTNWQIPINTTVKKLYFFFRYLFSTKVKCLCIHGSYHDYQENIRVSAGDIFYMSKERYEDIIKNQPMTAQAFKRID